MNLMYFIKKCCERAEGFEEFKCGNIGFVTLPNDKQITVSMLIHDKLAYPLLLQKSIEGFNLFTANDGYKYINQTHNGIGIFYNMSDWFNEGGKWFDYVDFNSIEETKEKALEYLFERMDE